MTSLYLTCVAALFKPHCKYCMFAVKLHCVCTLILRPSSYSTSCSLHSSGYTPGNVVLSQKSLKCRHYFDDMAKISELFGLCNFTGSFLAAEQKNVFSCMMRGRMLNLGLGGSFLEADCVSVHILCLLSC